MFSFGFHFDGSQPVVPKPLSASEPTSASKNQTILEFKLEKITKDAISESLLSASTCVKSSPYSFGNIQFFIATKNTKFGEVKEVVKYTDVLSGIYEGGFKIWEATFDLISYFHTQVDSSKFETVCDVGCGQGLLGLAAGISNPQLSKIYFLDLNQDVLLYSTIPNLSFNFSADFIINNCELISGDWRATNFQSLLCLDMNKPNLVLASEVLYNPDYYAALGNLLFFLLSPKNSLALISTKRYYFGVGGGTQAFLSLTKHQFGSNLACEVVTTFENGISNTRDIISVKRLDIR